MESPVLNIQIPNSVFFTFFHYAQAFSHNEWFGNCSGMTCTLVPAVSPPRMLFCLFLPKCPGPSRWSSSGSFFLTASSWYRLAFTVPYALLPFLLPIYILSFQLVFVRGRDFVSFIFVSLVPGNIIGAQ